MFYSYFANCDHCCIHYFKQLMIILGWVTVKFHKSTNYFIINPPPSFKFFEQLWNIKCLSAHALTLSFICGDPVNEQGRVKLMELTEIYTHNLYPLSYEHQQENLTLNSGFMTKVFTLIFIILYRSHVIHCTHMYCRFRKENSHKQIWFGWMLSFK